MLTSAFSGIASSAVELDGHTLVATACTNISLHAVTNKLIASADTYTFTVRKGTPGNPYTYSSITSCSLSNSVQSCTASSTTSLSLGDTLGVNVTGGTAAWNTSTSNASLHVLLTCN